MTSGVPNRPKCWNMHPAASEAPVVLVGNVGVALVIDWKRTDVVYVQTLEWIVGRTSEWMRLNEDF